MARRPDPYRLLPPRTGRYESAIPRYQRREFPTRHIDDLLGDQPSSNVIDRLEAQIAVITRSEEGVISQEPTYGHRESYVG
jgi:hypothetical protein